MNLKKINTKHLIVFVLFSIGSFMNPSYSQTGVYLTEDFENFETNVLEVDYRLKCHRPNQYFSIQSNIVRNGNYAASFESPDGGQGNGGGRRCEMVFLDRGHFNWGEEKWMGFSFMIPYTPTGHGLMSQHHSVPGPIGSPDWDISSGANGFSIRNATAPPSSKFSIRLIPPGNASLNYNSTGTMANPLPGSASRGTTIYHEWDIANNRWFDIVMNFKYSDTNNGFFKVWIDGDLVIDITGSNVHLHDVAGRLKERRNYFQFGIYTGYNGAGKIYYDEIRIGDGTSNYAGVAPRGGGTAPPPPPLPEAVNTPNPINNATSTSVSPNLTWSAGTDTTSYDVYFGTSSPPPLVGNQTSTSYSPGTLALDTTYYWQIDAVNSVGTTTGTEWGFATQTALPVETTYEGELLTVSGSSEDDTLDVVNNACGNGQYYLYKSNNIDDYVIFDVEVPQAGEQMISIDFWAHVDRGTVQLSINGTDVGSPIDQHRTSQFLVTHVTTDYYTFPTAGTYQFKFANVARNANSGGHKFAIDLIGLTANDTTPSPSNILLDEDFSYNNGSLPAGWWSEGNTAEIRNGRLYVNGIGGNNASTIWYDQEYDGDLRIEFDVFVNAAFNDANNINFFLLYSDPSGTPLYGTRTDRSDGAYSKYHSMNGYIATYVNSPDHSGVAPARFRLRNVPPFNNGNIIAETFDYTSEINVLRKIVIERIGDRITYSVDGTIYLDALNNQHTSGLIGFRTWKTELWWDNLKITDLGAAMPLSIND